MLQVRQRAELEQSEQPVPLPLFTIGASARRAACSAGRRSPGNPQNSHRLHGGMRFAFWHSKPTASASSAGGAMGHQEASKFCLSRAIRMRSRAGKA